MRTATTTTTATAARRQWQWRRRRRGRPTLLRRRSRGDDRDERLEPQTSGEEEEEEDEASLAGGDGKVTTTANLVANIVANPAFYLVGGLVAVRLVGQNDAPSSSSVVTTVLLSAAPVVLLTLLSKSGAGKAVQQRLEERLPSLRIEAQLEEEARMRARVSLPSLYGAERVRFLGPLGRWFAYPPHLTGELPGDVGFDPLGLARDPDALKRLHEVEVLHARWAMLAAVGCVVPELLPDGSVAEPLWFKVGAAVYRGVTIDYGGLQGFRIAGAQGLGVIALCQVALMGGPEYARYVGINSLEPVGIFLPGNQSYPGGPLFDPLGLAEDPASSERLKVAEVKHGRLAMLAMLGYGMQAAVTNEGIAANVVKHVADPAHYNIVTLLFHGPTTNNLHSL